MSAPKIQYAMMPHSWTFATWPKEVYPNTLKRAKYLYRTYMDELVLANAVSRKGREVVFYGPAYTTWLMKDTGAVKGYVVPANRPEHKDKRHNGAGNHAGDVS